MAGEATQFDDAGASEYGPNWGELEELLAGFARLAKSDAPLSQLAQQLLDHVVGELAAVAAAFWLTDGPGSLRLERQANIGVLGENALTDPHRQLLIETLRLGQAVVLAPHEAGAGTNPTDYTLILVPVVIDTQPVGLVEVVQRPDISADAKEGNLRFVALLTELTADHLRRREVRRLRDARRRSEEFDKFLLTLNRSLDPKATAAELASGARRHLGCGRAAVALRRGRGYRLAAVSSVDVINRRAASVKRLERLVARVAATSEPLWYEGEGQSLPPQIETALAEYLDESHARSLAVLPLRAPARDDHSPAGNLIGSLILEGFDAEPWDADQEATVAVARHGAAALANALRHRSLPTLPFARSGTRVSGEPTHRTARLAAVLTLIAALASTFVLHADFNLHAQGELQPANRRHVFAPRDGQVSVVAVEHGDAVAAGETLAEMASPELDLEIQKIQGEHDATLQRSVAIEAALLDYGSSINPEDVQINQLAAEQEELRQLFASQQQRLTLLRAEREKLSVRSPLAGEVLTWETDEQLRGRPVRRGQRLMTVADLGGGWEAELEAPDDEVGPLLELLDEVNEPIAVSFELATERGVEHHGELIRVAGRTEVGAENQPVVRLAVRVDGDSLEAPRPGATVYAKIHCGRRTVFYVWCHDVIDRVRGWLQW